MKTVLKVYGDYCAAKAAFEEDRVNYRDLGITCSHISYGKLVLGLDGFMIFYKHVSDTFEGFRGLSVDEIYFDDLVCIDDRIKVEAFVRVNQAPEEGKEFYYVIEQKIGGDISQTVKTNDKALVLQVIKGGL